MHCTTFSSFHLISHLQVWSWKRQKLQRCSGPPPDCRHGYQYGRRWKAAGWGSLSILWNSCPPRRDNLWQEECHLYCCLLGQEKCSPGHPPETKCCLQRQKGLCVDGLVWNTDTQSYKNTCKSWAPLGWQKDKHWSRWRADTLCVSVFLFFFVCPLVCMHTPCLQMLWSTPSGAV